MLYGGFPLYAKVAGEVIDVEANMGVHYCFVHFLRMGAYVCARSLRILLRKGYATCQYPIEGLLNFER